MDQVKVEICAGSVESCRIAEEVGADRVELCAWLSQGGSTPSLGMLRKCRRVLHHTRMHVLIRPEGSFSYDEDAVRVMLSDIEVAREEGADGVVVGALSPEGGIDIPVVHRLAEAAEGMSLTFHRAFDLLRYSLEGLDTLVELGFDRILTSGCRPDVVQGRETLKRLQNYAAGRITLLAGGGVREENIRDLAEYTGVREFHFSARQKVDREASVVDGDFPAFGFGEVAGFETSRERVLAIMHAVGR